MTITADRLDSGDVTITTDKDYIYNRYRVDSGDVTITADRLDSGDVTITTDKDYIYNLYRLDSGDGTITADRLDSGDVTITADRLDSGDVTITTDKDYYYYYLSSIRLQLLFNELNLLGEFVVFYISGAYIPDLISSHCVPAEGQ